MKPRCDITLGEMQDECKRVDRKCEKCDRRISVVCGSMVNSNGYFETPKDWDFSDPPRFDERQTELLKAYYAIGVRSLVKTGGDEFVSLRGEKECVLGTIYRSMLPSEIQKEISLDLAEMFGGEKE